MKNRFLCVILCVLMLASSVGLFVSPAAASEPDFGAAINGGRYLQWDYVPGADKFIIYQTEVGYGGFSIIDGDEFHYSDMPLDLKTRYQSRPDGTIEIYVVAQKKRSSGGYETIGSSNKVYYENKTGIPHFPTPVAKWVGTDVEFEPIDLKPYSPYMNGDDLAEAIVTVYENKTEIGERSVKLIKGNVIHLDKLIEFPDRNYQFSIRFTTSRAAGGAFWSKVGTSHYYASETVLGSELMNGYTTTGFIEGSVNIGVYATYGLKLTASCSGLNVPSDSLHYVWEHGLDGEHWTFDSDRSTFTPEKSHIGTLVRVRVSADGYGGYLTSNSLRVYKGTQGEDPAKPELEISSAGDRILVKNGKRAQEYYVSTQKLTTEQLESLWKDSWHTSSGSDGEYKLSGTKNKINYVYTRLMSTDTLNAGYKVAMSYIYFGEYGLKFNVQIPDYTFEGEDGEHYCLKSDRAAYIEVTCPAEGSLFNGVYGRDWKATRPDGSTYTVFYSDLSCTKPLVDGTQYKRVYFKKSEQCNHVKLSAYYKGHENLVYMNVGNKDNIVPDKVTIEDIVVQAGTNVGGFRPLSDPQGIDSSKVSGSYYLDVMNVLLIQPNVPSPDAPKVTNSYKNESGFDLYDGTLHVDATKAKTGEYLFGAFFKLEDGSYVPMCSFTVTVTDFGTGVEGVKLSTDSAVISPGGSIQLTANLLPTGVKGTVKWESNNELVRVYEDGVVIVSGEAKVGTTAKITASCNGYSDVCTVTVVQANPFKDVPYGTWYTEGVLYCYEHGFMTGTSDTEFSPKSAFTRAMFVTVLAKLDHADVESYTGSSFDDVPAGKWYSKPIQWAYTHGYAAGLGNGKFGPNNPVTREQLAVFLCNYTDKKGQPITNLADLSGYTDAGKISSYAVTGMKWAVGNGMISGNSETTLNPKGTASRAQVAVIVKSFAVKYYLG